MGKKKTEAKRKTNQETGSDNEDRSELSTLVHLHILDLRDLRA